MLAAKLFFYQTTKGQAKKRIAEFDRIFKRIYEDDINGTISHERFLKLSAEYEAEQRELTEKVNNEQKEVDTYEQDKSDFDSFAAVIRKYVGITELTPAIVNEFIKKIIVHIRIGRLDLEYFFLLFAECFDILCLIEVYIVQLVGFARF